MILFATLFFRRSEWFVALTGMLRVLCTSRYHVYIYIYIDCMYVFMYVCMYVCMHACMHVCMYVCMYVCYVYILCRKASWINRLCTCNPMAIAFLKNAIATLATQMQHAQRHFNDTDFFLWDFVRSTEPVARPRRTCLVAGVCVLHSLKPCLSSLCFCFLMSAALKRPEQFCIEKDVFSLKSLPVFPDPTCLRLPFYLRQSRLSGLYAL